MWLSSSSSHPRRRVPNWIPAFAGMTALLFLAACGFHLRGETITGLKTIHVPALVLWGEEDQWVDSKMADRLAHALPDGRLVRLPGVARLVPEENPEHMASLILDFMKRRAVA